MWSILLKGISQDYLKINELFGDVKPENGIFKIKPKTRATKQTHILHWTRKENI